MSYVGLFPPLDQSQEHDQAEDDALVIAAQSGCQSAFGELCLRNAGKVYRSISRVAGDHADAEDALQDSLIRAFVHIRQFDRRSSFSSWLTRIGINSALMIRRKKRRTRETSLCPINSDDTMRRLWEVADIAPNPEEHCLLNDMRLIMDHAICGLPLQLRVVAELRMGRDLSVREIAAILNISIPATKSRLVRAKRRIAGMLRRKYGCDARREQELRSTLYPATTDTLGVFNIEGDTIGGNKHGRPQTCNPDRR